MIGSSSMVAGESWPWSSRTPPSRSSAPVVAAPAGSTGKGRSPPTLAGRRHRPGGRRSAGPTVRTTATCSAAGRSPRATGLRLLAQQGSERLLEVAHCDPAKVKHRQQRIQVRHAPCPARQNGEAEALVTGAGTAVADFHPLHRHQANAGLGRPLRAPARAHHAVAPVRQPLLPHPDQERFRLRFNGLRQHPAALRQDGCQPVPLARADGVRRQCYR